MERWIKELRGFAVIEIEAGTYLKCCDLECAWKMPIGEKYLDRIIESAQVHNIEARH